MEAKDSSDEEEDRTHNISAFTKLDDGISMRNPKVVERPASGRRAAIMKRSKSRKSTDDPPPPPPPPPPPDSIDVRSPRSTHLRRYSIPENSFNKVMEMDSETSDSEDSEELDIDKIAKAQYYDFKQIEDLDISAEVKELFQNITRYTPQKIDLNYKLIPFIPDFIPAVGDIDAFLKVPRPDGVSDQVGLTVLDEPAAEQSEPAVLHLQLRSKTRSATGTSKASVVKRLQDVSRQGRMIDKWIEDMGELHRSKPPTAVEMSNRFPDMEALLCQWPIELEEKLNLEPPVDLNRLDCNLFQLIDLICALLDIPVYGNARIESLHTLFSLYTQVHNVDIQTIH